MRPLAATAVVLVLMLGSTGLAQPVRPPATRPVGQTAPRPGVPTAARPESAYSKLPQADLLTQRKAEGELARDGKRPDDQREKAAANYVLISAELCERFAADPHVHQWRLEAVDLLIDVRIDPTSRKTIYEISSRDDRQNAVKAIDQAEQILLGQQALQDQLTRMDNEGKFNDPVFSAEYDKLEGINTGMKSQKVLLGLWRAQFLWANGLPEGKAQRDAVQKDIGRYHQAVLDFFREFVTDADANLKLPWILYVGWSSLFAGQIDEAIGKADAILGDAAATPLQKFEALTLKAQTLRSIKKFGEPATADKPASGAIAVIDEQAKLAATPQLVKEPVWRLFNLLARANCMVQQAASVCHEKLDKAASLAKQSPAEGKNLENQALAEYEKAREDIPALFAEAGKADPSLDKKTLEMLPSGMWKDPKLDDESGGAPVPPMTAAELEAKRWPELKSLAARASSNKQFDVAVELYGELLKKLASLQGPMAQTQKPEILFGLGRSYFFLAQKLEKDSQAFGPSPTKAQAAQQAALKAKAVENYRQADKYLGQVVSNHEKKRDILIWLWVAVNRQEDSLEKVADPPIDEKLSEDQKHKIAEERRVAEEARNAALAPLRKEAVDVLKQLIDLSADEAEKVRYQAALGDRYRLAGDHAQCIEEWSHVPPSSTQPDYAKVRQDMCWEVLKVYATSQPDMAQLDGNLKILQTYEQVIKPRVQAGHPGPWPPTTTAPDATADPLAWQRYLGASFRLEAGRVCMRLSDQSHPDLVKKGVELIQAVPPDYPDLGLIKSRSRNYLIQSYLVEKDYKKAANALLDIVRNESANPRQVEMYTDEVLGSLESDYKDFLKDNLIGEARDKARQAEQFMVDLIEGAANSNLPADTIYEFQVRQARTLNWQEKYKEAWDILWPLYKPMAEIKYSWEKGAPKRDPDIVIELADAFRGLGKFREALNLYALLVPSELAQYYEYAPPIAEFDEYWWRAMVGEAECFNALKERVLTMHGALTGKFAQAAADELKLAPGKPHVALPAYLKPRYDNVEAALRGKIHEIYDAHKVAPPPEPAAATVKAPVASNFKVGLLLVGGCVAGLALILLVAFLRIQSQRKHKLVLRPQRP